VAEGDFEQEDNQGQQQYSDYRAANIESPIVKVKCTGVRFAVSAINGSESVGEKGCRVVPVVYHWPAEK